MNQENTREDKRNLIIKVVRLTGLGFLLAGLAVFFLIGDQLLGWVLGVTGIVEIFLTPRILEIIFNQKK